MKPLLLLILLSGCSVEPPEATSQFVQDYNVSVTSDCYVWSEASEFKCVLVQDGYEREAQWAFMRRASITQDTIELPIPLPPISDRNGDGKYDENDQAIQYYETVFIRLQEHLAQIQTLEVKVKRLEEENGQLKAAINNIYKLVGLAMPFPEPVKE